MTAIPMPTLEECYLLAIFDDPSGIELAEFCTAAYTPVLTRRGHVPISEVQVGDEVLTHKGRWRKVTAVWDRGVKDVVRLKGVGQPGLVLTPDHKLYARKARQGLTSVEGHRDVFLLEPEWLEASETEFGGSGRVRNTRYATPAAVESTDDPTCTPEMAWLLGRWLADGSKYHRSATGSWFITWAIRARDVADFEVRLKAAGYGRYCVAPTQSAECKQVGLYGRDLYDWLPQARAENKQLPTWVYGATEDVRRAVLEGYLSGDGYWSGSSWQASTVSERLAYDLRILAATLGWSVSMSVTPGAVRTKFGRPTMCRTLYSLTITDDGGWAHHEGGLQWSMLKSCEDAGQAHVYDLSVEEDHSFVAAGTVVHNCWIDEEQEDGCYRVWDFQWAWYRCDDTYQIDYAGRSLGKSVGIQMRAFAFCFNHPGMEMLITAPELNHLRPITDKVEHQILSHRLTREMLPKQRGNGINHQPQFQVHFRNNTRIISRLPQRDGRGVKGMHPLVIEADEMQDFPDNGWVELIETMKSGVPGAQWRCHGVSRGVRDRYYRYTTGEGADLPFTVHRYMAMHRPFWSAEERKNKIAIYGGTEDNVDYRRNVYGEHGDATNPVFVLARLMGCVRMNESPWATTYNEDIYCCLKVNDELLRKVGTPIQNFLDLPMSHLDKAYGSFWAGMDVGFTRDPSEILVFGEMEQKGGDSLLRLLARIHLMRISAADQAEAVRHLFSFYGERLRRFTLDKTGNGLPLWQELAPELVGTHHTLRRTPDHIAARIKGYGFSQKIAVDFDDRPLVGRERPEDAVIEKNVIDFATDELRKLVDARPARIELANDRELLTEWQGQEVQYVRDEGSAAGIKRRYGGEGGSFHTLDAAKMMIAGRNLQMIDAVLNQPRRPGPTLDRFFG